MSELSTLRAQYKELAGKNPSPALKADALQAKIAELQAAAAAAAPAADPQEPPAADPAPVEPPASPAAPAADPAAAPEAAAPSAGDEPASDAESESEDELSVEDACAELGLSIEADGHCPVEMLESVSGGVNLRRGDPHLFEAAEAVRAVRAGIARPRG